MLTFSKDVAWAAVANGAGFAIAVKRAGPVWRAVRKVPGTGWLKAIGTEAEVAECGYVPAGWPPGTRTICRRVKLSPEEVSRDARSRRRRTVDPEQLALSGAGEAVPIYAYSFIITNLDWDICEIGAWSRERALVEESDQGLGVRRIACPHALWLRNGERALGLVGFHRHEHLLLAPSPHRPRQEVWPSAWQTAPP